MEFQTFNAELKNFLMEDAIRNQDMYISNTYLVKYRSLLVGYMAILNDNISLDGNLKVAFRNKGIDYKSLPAMKIGRMCVDNRYRGKKIGTFMVAECIKRICNLNTNCACRFLVVDSKRNQNRSKDSLHFYKKLGFEILLYKNKTENEAYDQTKGSTPMYLDLYHIIKDNMHKKIFKTMGLQNNGKVSKMLNNDV